MLNPVMAAASRMLRRSQNRIEARMSADTADEFFTAIVSVHDSANTEKVIKAAKEKGLDPKPYDECRVAVTGKRDKVLAFQEWVRISFLGEELPPTEGVHVVKDLVKMSHDLPNESRLGREVALALQDLRSLNPVSAPRMKQYKNLVERLKTRS